MGYVGDAVFNNWIMIFYHNGGNDQLRLVDELHDDNCSTNPFQYRWGTPGSKPYDHSINGYPHFELNGGTEGSDDHKNTELTAAADSIKPTDWDEDYYKYVVVAKKTMEEDTPITMSLDGTTFVDRTANVKLKVTSTEDLSAKDLRLFVGVTMDTITYNYGQWKDYGELKYHRNVWVGWVGDATYCGAGCEDGQEISLEKDIPVERDYTWTLSDSPPDQVTWDQKDMIIVAFVQDFGGAAGHGAPILQGVKLMRSNVGRDVSAPNIAFSPINQATGVALDSDITLTFDEKIQNSDGSELTNDNVDALITLKKNDATGDDLAKEVTINGDKTVITIDPTNDLELEQRVYVAIGATVGDEAGNIISPRNITFTTLDNTSPIATINPINSATGVAPASNITVSFNEPVQKTDGSALDGSVITLKKTDASGDAIPFSASVDAANKVLTIDPTSDLESSQKVYVCVNGVEDYSGNALSETCATFTTADANAPTVKINPKNGDTNVPVNTKITLTFSETVRNTDASPLDDTNVGGLVTLKYENASGSSISFDATIDSDKKIVELTPSSNLEYEKEVYVAIGATVEDISGNDITAQSATFTTVSIGNAPLFTTINDTSFREDRSGFVNVTITDNNGDNIIVSVVSDTSAVEADVEESNSVSATEWTAKIALKPGENWNGDANITIYADDGTTISSETFKLTIKPVDDAPTPFEISEPMNNGFIRITDQTYNDTLVFRWKASTDPEGDTITYKYSGTWGIAGLSVPYVKNGTETKIAYSDIYASIDQSDLTHWTDNSKISGEWSISACSGMFCVPSANGPYKLTIAENVLGLSDDSNLPDRYTLHQNYPNPFNPRTVIRYELPNEGNVSITIFDLSGKQIRSLVSSSEPAGYRSTVWDGTNDRGETVTSGVYLYRIHAGQFIQTKKMIFLQ